MREPRVVLITGASSGIGAACAQHLAAKGHHVYGGCRSGRLPYAGARAIQVDVTQDRSVQEAIYAIETLHGRIDVLVNCAGYGLAGAVEHTSIEEARDQFEVNFFGYLRMCKAVLPQMRKRNDGVIVNLSSIGGLVGLPFQSIYSASKFAVEGWSEGLALELAPDGIRVVLIEPGDMKTRFTANRRWAQAARAANCSLSRRSQEVLSVVEKDEAAGPAPDAVARLVELAILSPRPRLRQPVGLLSQRVVLTIKRWTPEWLFHFALSNHYGLRSG